MKKQLRLLLCCLGLVILSACEKEDILDPHFVVSYPSTRTVAFGNTTVGTEESPRDKFQSFWDFGNGQTSTEQSPTYTYPTAGLYTVKLTVKNTAGKEFSVTGVVNPK